MATVCAGCWEEIHYTPAAAPTASEAPGSSPESDESPAATADADSASTAAPTAEPTTPAPPLAEAPASIDPPVSEPPPEVKTATPRERLLAWRAASKWSLAAAAYAKGLEASRYETLQREANEAASELGVELPELPTTDEEIEREAAIIDSLRTGAGAQLADAVEERFGSQAGAAARLAVSSHLLLLIYSPQDPNATAHAVALREVAEAADLPADLWQPLAELIESQAEFLDVRGAVFKLHQQVEEHFGRL